SSTQRLSNQSPVCPCGASDEDHDEPPTVEIHLSGVRVRRQEWAVRRRSCPMPVPGPGQATPWLRKRRATRAESAKHSRVQDASKPLDHDQVRSDPNTAGTKSKGEDRRRNRGGGSNG